MGEVRKLASQGIPDGAGIRATVWKVQILIKVGVYISSLLDALQFSNSKSWARRKPLACVTV